MNFRRAHRREDPEINLIPLIDVLLVILIFLLTTTTFGRQGGVRINLPTANANASQSGNPKKIEVFVSEKGEVKVGDVVIDNHKTDANIKPTTLIAGALMHAAGEDKNPIIIIHADRNTTHQKVVDVMQASADAGYTRLTFATQLTK